MERRFLSYAQEDNVHERKGQSGQRRSTRDTSMTRCAMARRHDSVTKEMSTMSGGESYLLEKYNGAADREVV